MSTIALMKGGNNRILIVDHGIGNIGSLKNALSSLGFTPITVSHEDNFREDESLCGFIIPGVGTFDEGIKSLRAKKLDHVIKKLTIRKVPGLAICLGMQLLCKRSEESANNEIGLGYFDANVKLLNHAESPVPSIGWNTTYQTWTSEKNYLKLLNGDFYYLHSYYVDCLNDNDRVATYNHGDSAITSAIEKDALLGVQFHPEKSQYQGLSLLKNYFCTK